MPCDVLGVDGGHVAGARGRNLPCPWAFGSSSNLSSDLGSPLRRHHIAEFTEGRASAVFQRQLPGVVERGDNFGQEDHARREFQRQALQSSDPSLWRTCEPSITSTALPTA